MSFRFQNSLVFSLSALFVILVFRLNSVQYSVNSYHLADWFLFVFWSIVIASSLNINNFTVKKEKWLLQGLLIGISTGIFILALRYFSLLLLLYFGIIEPVDGAIDGFFIFIVGFLLLTFGDLTQDGGVFVVMVTLGLILLLKYNFYKLDKLKSN